MDNSTIPSESNQAAPDYSDRMRASIDLLNLAKGLHSMQLRLRRAKAAVDVWPESLVWRQERQVAQSAVLELTAAYDAALCVVPWHEWGLIEESGP